MNTTLILLPLSLIFTFPLMILNYFPAIFISLIILLIIFKKKPTMENFFWFLYGAKPDINSQVEKISSLNSVFKSSKNISLTF